MSTADKPQSVTCNGERIVQGPNESADEWHRRVSRWLMARVRGHVAVRSR